LASDFALRATPGKAVPTLRFFHFCDPQVKAKRNGPLFTSFIRFTASGFFDRRDGTVLKKALSMEPSNKQKRSDP